MKTTIHRSEARGYIDHGWLKTHHSFSFGQWYDPDLMGVGALRVINEDIIAPQRGFATHPHKDMEILTYVISGTLTHQDSMGNQTHITAGEWQLMRAGTGIRHSEVNQGPEAVHLFQIWIQPDQLNLQPHYQQIRLDAKETPNQWQQIAANDQQAPMHIHQQVRIETAYLQQQQQLALPLTGQKGYLHVIDGEVIVNQQRLSQGDAIQIDQATAILAQTHSHLLYFDLAIAQPE
ncbi:pirin family protein [Acinetobacter larvae]|uniref:Pirin family protein n=1 Tax=Acinetobacter larvae TaxID=1789224 RepID=A0A1B2M0Z3_9GAMM|nr:pirin-like bicupin family protein [Acinetobacter larvae]AOA58872.1 hypothetical protein BFG52_11240 [Acinetobacter larvae]